MYFLSVLPRVSQSQSELHLPLPACRFALAALTLIAACSTSASVSDRERQTIVDSLTRQVKAAYDLSKPNVDQRLLSLYPPSGRVVSAAGGQVLTSRDTLAMGIKAFWQNVGANMREPKWIWDQMVFDVLSPTAAVMTAQYHIPHLTPRNQPHTISGAWTAVFQKRGDRWYIVQEHLSDALAMPDSASAAPDSTQAPAMTPGMKMPPGMKMSPGKKMP
jgi:ketosteroid isomerase-like protein